jgi:outer membrane protein OmpA-like peptidoglycan-associated protein
LRELKIRNIYYPVNRYQIEPEERRVLDRLADFMLKNPSVELVANSYADSRGSSKHNQAVTDKRSHSVKAYLAGKGVDPSKIRTGSFGERHLVNNCVDGLSCSEAEQQLNRRTEFKVKLQDSIAVSAGLPQGLIQVELPEFTERATEQVESEVQTVYYGFDSYRIESIYYNHLDSTVAALKEHPNLKVKIASFTDSKGSIVYNTKLSKLRSAAVKSYLKSKGIEDSRIITESLGEKSLVNNCADGADCSDEQQQLNRRTEFTIIK